MLPYFGYMDVDIICFILLWQGLKYIPKSVLLLLSIIVDVSKYYPYPGIQFKLALSDLKQ